MSVEYDFKLKRKGQNVKDAPYLTYFGSMAARMLYEDGLYFVENKENVDEYDGWQVLSHEQISNVLRTFRNKIKISEESEAKDQKEIDEYREMMSKAGSVEVYRAIQEDMYAIQSGILEEREDREMLIGIINVFNMLEDILESNVDYPSNESQYEIVYYFA